MNLVKLLSDKKTAILDKWFSSVISTYPPDTANFLQDQKDRFSNPVGFAIRQGMEGIFNEFITDSFDSGKITPFLDSIIRVRAIQDFTASQAIDFIFQLKTVIWTVIQEDAKKENILPVTRLEELRLLEAKIDNIALLAFNIYMQCRERIYEIKANEVKNMTFRLLQQANLICEMPDRPNQIDQGPDTGSKKIIQMKRGD